MNLVMSITELNEIKNINFNGISIMDCPLSKLEQICKEALDRIDNYQQIAGDKNNAEMLEYFVDAYFELEPVYFLLKEKILASIRSRNQIRILIKYVEKMASCMLND